MSGKASGNGRSPRLWPALGALVAVVVSMAAMADDWKLLEKDGIHDPTSPAIKLLQQPRDALIYLPEDEAGIGNQVRWVDALEEGAIEPRTNIKAETRIRVYERDVLMNLYGSMPPVRFPHLQHTLWLDCANCHDILFKKRAGENPISMLSILEGEQCGVCHGAVSFPLTECVRCHSVPRGLMKVGAGHRAIVVDPGEIPAIVPPKVAEKKPVAAPAAPTPAPTAAAQAPVAPAPASAPR